MANLPTISELQQDSVSAFKNDQLNALLNQEPPPQWVKTHPFIKDHKYIPIERVEYLLKKLFKKYKIEILREGSSFNGVYVVVRVHYLNPISNEMDWHDGIGACQLQTKAGTSPADMININNGAVSMAFPIAKTFAVKDACDHFGKLFGADLNRKDGIVFKMDSFHSKEELEELFELKRQSLDEGTEKRILEIIDNEEKESYKKVINILKSK